MSDVITPTIPWVQPPALPMSKWDREHAAFCRLLPDLMISHNGQYVAIHNEQVVGVGNDKMALALDVLKRVGNLPIHVGLVTADGTPAARSGVRREVKCSGGGA